MNGALPKQHKLTLYPDTHSYFTGEYFCDESAFAPPIPGNTVERLASGKEVFEKILDAMKSAEKFIFIADWQMGFDVELSQRGNGDHPMRLIKVFEDIIRNRAIQIRVLLWFSPIESQPGTFDRLVTKTINAINNKGYPGKIVVMRQLSSSAQGKWFNYAHHQKFVVVDGKVGFLGGIDLSYGRYETPEYDVVLDPSIRVINDMYNTCATKLRGMSPGEQELVTRGFAGAYGGTLLEEGCQARMPWQDVQLKFTGPAVVDLYRNFVRRWNATLRARMQTADNLEAVLALILHQPTIVRPHQIANLRNETLDNPAPIDSAWLDHYGVTAMLKEARANKNQGQAVVQIVRSVSSKQLQLETPVEHRSAARPPDDIDLEADPYHQLLMTRGVENLRDKHQSNIQNAMLNCILTARNYIYIENQFFISDFGKVDNVNSKTIGNEGNGINNLILEALGRRIACHINARTPFHVYLVIPVHPEGPIGDAPVWHQHWQALASIEWGSTSLVNRIRKSLESVKRPPDEWPQYLTVLNMRNYGVAVQYARDPKTFAEDYRREIGRYVITEQIYIHSKMMIVDDAVAIIGTANINDRSMTGNGDTEVAAVVMDNEGGVTHLDLGSPKILAPTRKFARELRRSLWEKHFGFALNEKAYFNTTERAIRHHVTPHPLPDGAHPPRVKTTEGKLGDALKSLSINGVSWQHILDKPCDPDTVKAIQAIAASNAKVYETVFLHTPRNSMKDFQDIASHHTLPYPVLTTGTIEIDAYQADAKRRQEEQYLSSFGYPQSPPGARARAANRARIDREYAEATAASEACAAQTTHGVIPPPLQPQFMTTALEPHQQAGLRVPLTEFHNRYVAYPGNRVHNVGATIKYLKANVVGFFVAAPLSWGRDVKVRDPSSVYMGIVNIADATQIKGTGKAV
jgi:phospholipase D1/2